MEQNNQNSLIQVPAGPYRIGMEETQLQDGGNNFKLPDIILEAMYNFNPPYKWRIPAEKLEGFKIQTLLTFGPWWFTYKAFKIQPKSSPRYLKCTIRLLCNWPNTKRREQELQREFISGHLCQHRFILRTARQHRIQTNRFNIPIWYQRQQEADVTLEQHLILFKNNFNKNERLMWMAEITDSIKFLHRYGIAHLNISFKHIMLLTIRQKNKTILTTRLFNFSEMEISPKTQMAILNIDPSKFKFLFGYKPETTDEEIRSKIEQKNQFFCNDLRGNDMGFMAPEVISCYGAPNPYHPMPADIWSLGASFCYLMFDHGPFLEPNLNQSSIDSILFEYYNNILQQKWKITDEERSSLNVEQKDFFLKMLLLDPSARPNIQEVANVFIKNPEELQFPNSTVFVPECLAKITEENLI